MLPSVMTSVRNTAMNTAATPKSLPNWVIGTRPTNIIRKMTTQSSAAVDRFSMPMRKVAMPKATRIHLKAILSAPSSRCVALSICAV